MQEMGQAKTITRDDLTEAVHGIGQDVNVKMVYGEPQTLQGRTIIPVAQIRYAGGGGFGGGGGRQAGEQTEQSTGQGEGMGVGVRVRARPVGMLEVTGEGERWIPTVDVNRIITIWSIMMGMVFMTIARSAFRVRARHYAEPRS